MQNPAVATCSGGSAHSQGAALCQDTGPEFAPEVDKATREAVRRAWKRYVSGETITEAQAACLIAVREDLYQAVVALPAEGTHTANAADPSVRELLSMFRKVRPFNAPFRNLLRVVAQEEMERPATPVLSFSTWTASRLQAARISGVKEAPAVVLERQGSVRGVPLTGVSVWRGMLKLENEKLAKRKGEWLLLDCDLVADLQ